MKIYDYGKMAATFVNIETGKAVRLTVKETDDEKSSQGSGETSHVDKFLTLTDAEMLNIQDVKVDLRPEDLPGKPLRVVLCDQCGERIMDMRETEHSGKTQCRPCATGQKYYTSLN
jgi:formylmethanofuran dehydrogenase subunit E